MKIVEAIFGSFAIGFVLLWFGAIFAGIYGYVVNIINVIQHTGELMAVDILAIVGILIVPLGAIMGWVV